VTGYRLLHVGTLTRRCWLSKAVAIAAATGYNARVVTAIRVRMDEVRFVERL